MSESQAPYVVEAPAPRCYPSACGALTATIEAAIRLLRCRLDGCPAPEGLAATQMEMTIELLESGLSRVNAALRPTTQTAAA